LQFVFVVNVSALATAPKTAEQVPADIADLEAAVQAKYHLDEAKPASDAKPTADTPSDVAQLEAAVQAKYHIEEAKPASDPKPTADTPSDVAQLEAAVQAKYHLEEAKPASAAGEEAEVQTSQPQAKADIPAEIAQLEAAVQAKYEVPGSSSSQLFSPKPMPSWLQWKSQPQSSKHDAPKTEAADSEAFSLKESGVDSDASGTVAANAEVPAKATKLKVATQASPDREVESLEAAVQAKYHTDLALDEQVKAQAQMPGEVAEVPEPPATSASAKPQFRLKADAEQAELRAAETEAELPPASVKVEAEADMPADVAELEAAVQAKYTVEEDKNAGWKSQKVAMHDLPHYRKHGAAMVHVEPTPRRSNSSANNPFAKRAVNLTAARAEADAKLAAKRAEVEDFFHISKASAPQAAQPAVQAQEPVGAGRKFLLGIFSLAAVCSLAAIAYHKYEVILKICQGKQGPPMFKAKQEDIYSMEGGGFAPPPRYAQQNYQGWSATRLATQCSSRGLTRRGAADSMSCYDSGV